MLGKPVVVVMTWNWGTASLMRIATMDDKLVAALERARSKGCPELTIPQYGGSRTLAQQQILKDSGVSWTLDSLHRINEPGHNVGRLKSAAMDIAPYPIDWADEQRFEAVAAYILASAMKLDVRLEWGGLWSQRDLGHFQLIGD